MILVDFERLDLFFIGRASPEADRLDALLGNEPLLIGDLILTEVLQGFTSERDFNQAHRLLGSLDLVEIGGRKIATQAARNFRKLKALGLAVRNTIDILQYHRYTNRNPAHRIRNCLATLRPRL